MNIDNRANLTQLLTDVKDAVFASEPKRFTGNADYFAGLVGAVIDCCSYELGDREYLKNGVAYRLNTTYDKQGKKVTNWGYKRVLKVVEHTFNYVNK
ncbi:hypothetical protein [Vibrio hepatarius]|uniref:hypothetical protein n=1 Tax=Vibrio hepatarius TaxID=171383 RepID=UPI00142D2836|nr:hypothetical protein [Vibrio hepatarius]NIY84590.1 hypothetical protein [Vibrio hepatarius]